MAKGRMTSSDEAVPTNRQHTKPCGDCPWRPDSIPGWLGGHTAQDWIKEAHGEARIDCHTLKGPQCAGAAIYRANVCKDPRDPDLLQLPGDRKNVFATPNAFLNHHKEIK